MPPIFKKATQKIHMWIFWVAFLKMGGLPRVFKGTRFLLETISLYESNTVEAF